jgi:NitT/TauT family transport system substrate-binding protein
MVSDPKPIDGKVPVNRRAWLIGLAIVAVLVGAWLVWGARTAPSGARGSLEPVTLAANNDYAGACSVLAAQEQGHFKSEGLIATIKPHTSGKSALEAALSGRVDLATVADIPVMFAAMNGQPVSVVASIFRAERDLGIIARKDRGITVPADVKGKRVGVASGTSANFFFDAFINRQKLPAAAVTAVDLKPEAGVDALLKGEVDAISTWEPHLGRAQAQLGSNAALFYGEGIYEITYTLAGSRSYVAAHRETVKKVLRAVIRGAQFCSESGDAAGAMVAREMKVDPSTLRSLWPSYRFRVTLDQGLILALEDEARWAISNKLTPQTAMPNYLDHVDLNALKAIRPSAVTIIH